MQISTNTLNALNPNFLKTKRQKFGLSSLLFMLIFGATFTAIGLFFLSTTKISVSWKRVDGTVTGASPSNSDGSTTYAAIVSYKVNGQTYSVTNSSSSSSYPARGAVKQVAYDPADPQHATVVASGSDKAFLMIFPVIGLGMLVLGPVLFIRSLRRSKDINNLRQTGQKVQGVITDIQSQSSGTNQNGSGYRIAVSATGPDGSVQQYTSDWLQGIGGLAMTDFRTNPVAIDVYIDPANPQNYYVDVSEVPNITPERISELIQSAALHKTATQQNPAVVSLQSNEALPVASSPAPLPSPPSGQSQTPQTPPQQM